MIKEKLLQLYRFVSNPKTLATMEIALTAVALVHAVKKLRNASDE